MKSVSLILFIIAVTANAVFGQAGEITGKPIAELFTDFHINLSDTSSYTGFDLNRAYLGYQFLPGGMISATVIVNIGTPDDLPANAEPRRYAYCREASVKWSDENISVSMGITGTRIFMFQQKFWGKRYIAKPFQAIAEYGYVADLGIAADIKVNDLISVDVTLMNGEGYSNLQMDNNLRSSLGLILTPHEKLVFRLYGDIQKQDELWQPVLIGFAGFRSKTVTVGGEISYKSNLDMNRGHHAWGISATGGINVTESTEIFGRYDFISSTVLPGEILKWNHLNDGSFFIAGVQKTINEYSKIALNYQGNFPYSVSGQIADLIYLNALFKF